MRRTPDLESLINDNLSRQEDEPAGVSLGGTGVSDGGTGVSDGVTGVLLGGTGVLLGGTGVLLGGTGVLEGGTRVAVGLISGVRVATLGTKRTMPAWM